MFTGGGGADAAKASIRGSELQAGYQTQALDYLKQQERLPTAFREQALQQLGMLYGLPGAPQQAPQFSGISQQAPQLAPQIAPIGGAVGGGVPIDPRRMDPGRDYGWQPQSSFLAGTGIEALQGGYQDVGMSGRRYPDTGVGQEVPQMQQAPQTVSMVPQGDGFAPQGKGAFVQGLMQDPFYQGMLDVGEEAVLRGASATGGLRSGSTSEALARNNQAILRGLYGEQVAGLQGMAGLPSYAPQIAQATSGIGQTLAQGQIGAAQAQQTGQQQSMGNIMGLGQLGIGIAGLFSDRKLKENIVEIGKQGVHKIYTWTWNKLAEGLGLSGEGYGVMADEVENIKPDAVSIKDGYQFVDYQALGVM